MNQGLIRCQTASRRAGKTFWKKNKLPHHPSTSYCEFFWFVKLSGCQLSYTERLQTNKKRYPDSLAFKSIIFNRNFKKKPSQINWDGNCIHPQSWQHFFSKVYVNTQHEVWFWPNLVRLYSYKLSVANFTEMGLKY